jgi:two-component sensor histidine kinase
VATSAAEDPVPLAPRAPARPTPEAAGPLPRELDHRIANSLQLAADFLLLQQARMKDPFARAALIDAAERLVAVGHLHRFLSAHEGPGLIDLPPFLGELAAIIGQSTGLRCRTDVEEVQVPAGVAQQLGLAVNELAINAAKHAYHRGEAGEVLVEAVREGAGLRLTVSDHGAGLRPGFSLEGAVGLGLAIVQAIVRQLGARLVAEDHGGARFTIFVPLEARVGEGRSFSPE